MLDLLHFLESLWMYFPSKWNLAKRCKTNFKQTKNNILYVKIMVPGGITDIVTIRDELMISTKDGHILR